MAQNSAPPALYQVVMSAQQGAREDVVAAVLTHPVGYLWAEMGLLLPHLLRRDVDELRRYVQTDTDLLGRFYRVLDELDCPVTDPYRYFIQLYGSVTTAAARCMEGTGPVYEFERQFNLLALVAIERLYLVPEWMIDTYLRW